MRISTDPRPAMPALAALGSFTDRPLFWASRRPPRRVAAAASGTVGLVLSGVIISPSEKYAILARTDGKPPLRARVGQEAAGWRMAAISPDHVVLRNGDRRLVLKLGGKTPTAGAAVAVAGPRPPIPAPFDHLWRKDTRWLPR
ncbi:MAG: hypothetical protein KGL52_16125 [Rhodospirillales bacterium]|nr:hypothetical protein [Rhodospirillales bacterium]